MSSPTVQAWPRLGPGREFDLVRSLLEGAREAEGVRVGPGDDCAVLAGGIVLSTDLSVENVHFSLDWLSLPEVGYRAVAAATSDLAAMAAEPVGILLSLALPAGDPGGTLAGLKDGVLDACATAGAPLLGGDLSRSPGPLFLDVVAVGRAEDPLLRSGVRPGDEVWVTGHLGGSGAAVALWLDGRTPPPELRRAFARPEPRIRQARWLRERVRPRAMIDLSDGLLGDAGHLAAASGCSILLDARELPIHPAVRQALPGAAGLRAALSGGEDYELCFTAPPGVVAPHREAFAERFGLSLNRVGRAEPGSGVTVSGGPPDAVGGFDHFGAGDPE